MSWFKRGRNDSKISDISNGTDSSQSDCRSRTDTDPQTCLEVFQNHWKQALLVIKRDQDEVKGRVCTPDELEAVTQNFEQMITLLVGEEGLDENGQGMPGPILHFMLEEEVFDKFCNWCQYHPEHGEQLKNEQLRMFEQLISQSHQLLLIHKAVVQPLLKLLSLSSIGAETPSVENRLVLVLHQLCVCISQQTLILESFFNTTANHGPTKFLIFSLLIPFIHREGKVGQQARDALLLIMTLSSKHPHIGLYIAENTDFCPVLATGLSGLYSSLPRKIPFYTDEWHQFTQEDINYIPELQMFLNSLEFCNAVTQVGHPAIKTQLNKFIYSGFLVPVLGPALHQDISGLPLPLLDSPMFSNSREEVIAATAYLELFLRKTTEPDLVKTFLKFILTEQNDEIVILDSLITRINSSAKPLCVVSLALFRTLIDLNCEDVMFQLVFRYLIPCTHVMVSQRRNVKDLDLYCKSAERFLSLRPNCCTTDHTDSSKAIAAPHTEKSVLNSSDAYMPTSHERKRKHGLRSFLNARKREKEFQRMRSSTMAAESPKSAFPPGTFGSKLEHYESSYTEYLQEARNEIDKCAKACRSWVYPYDGDKPPCDVFIDSVIDPDGAGNSSPLGQSESKDGSGPSLTMSESNTKGANVELLSHGNSMSSVCSLSNFVSDETKKQSRAADEVFHDSSSQSTIRDISQILKHYESSECEDLSPSRLEEVNEFMLYLGEIDTPPEMADSVELSMQSLDSVLSDLSLLSTSRTSTPFAENSDGSCLGNKVYSSFLNENDSVHVARNNSNDGVVSEDEKVLPSDTVSSEDDSRKAKCDGTTFEVIDVSKDLGGLLHHPSAMDDTGIVTPYNLQDATSFVDISLSNFTNNKNTALSDIPRRDSLTANDTKPASSRRLSREDSTSKSVSFNLSNTSMQSSSATQVMSSTAAPKVVPSSPNIGAFLMALFSKLDGMMHNSLPVNLLLSGIIARLAAYPQPLLRSFLLSPNLVFQPTVKSLLQVITSLRQKVDHFAYTVPNFDGLILRARRTLIEREENWSLGMEPRSLYSIHTAALAKVHVSPVPENNIKEKRKASFTDMLFRRSPSTDKKQATPKRRTGPHLQIMQGVRGFRYINYHNRPQEVTENPMDSPKIRNAVYCAVILEEFVKELAALSQEHSVSIFDDEGYLSN